jgi:HD-GYP domain-containing protein (c-di-GMP phosphodiesterase class II)
MIPEELLITYLSAVLTAAWDQTIMAHAYRLVRPAQATAYQLGLSQEEISRVGLAALLHDLGKVGIPKAILSKPGPLTDEEWAIVQRHPETGCQILLQAGGIWGSLAPIVAAHHERWDGCGYPRRLAKEAIPLEARILSVVDAYDAMISPRVYQKPLSQEEARAELQRCAGHQFDPQVVAAFLRVLDEQMCSRVVVPPVV